LKNSDRSFSYFSRRLKEVMMLIISLKIGSIFWSLNDESFIDTINCSSNFSMLSLFITLSENFIRMIDYFRARKQFPGFPGRKGPNRYCSAKGTCDSQKATLPRTRLYDIGEITSQCSLV
jgi:hypothetical protein